MKALYTVIGIFVGVVIGAAIPRPEKIVEVQTPHQMSMEDTMHSMNASLSGKTGDTFDQAFLEEMIVHHQGAVDMANQVLATSKRPELTVLANSIISAQEQEIAQMKAWLEEWF